MTTSAYSWPLGEVLGENLEAIPQAVTSHQQARGAGGWNVWTGWAPSAVSEASGGAASAPVVLRGSPDPRVAAQNACCTSGCPRASTSSGTALSDRCALYSFQPEACEAQAAASSPGDQHSRGWWAPRRLLSPPAAAACSCSAGSAEKSSRPSLEPWQTQAWRPRVRGRPASRPMATISQASAPWAWSSGWTGRAPRWASRPPPPSSGAAYPTYSRQGGPLRGGWGGQSWCQAALGVQGESVIATAHTGSGKTATFALPILQRLAANPYGVFALVLTPTRSVPVGLRSPAAKRPALERCQGAQGAGHAACGAVSRLWHGHGPQGAPGQAVPLHRAQQSCTPRRLACRTPPSSAGWTCRPSSERWLPGPTWSSPRLGDCT